LSPLFRETTSCTLSGTSAFSCATATGGIANAAITTIEPINATVLFTGYSFTASFE
jgi:hypothetical protein